MSRSLARRLAAVERLCAGRPGYHTITVKALLTAMSDAAPEQPREVTWEARADHAVKLYAQTAIERDDARTEARTLRARIAELEAEAVALQHDKAHVVKAAEARIAGQARRLADRISSLGKARGWSTWAADYIHPDREFIDTGENTENEPAAAEPDTAAPTVVRCAHGYGLLRDSCPGCDHEQETPHDADPVTVRPTWAKRDMRRCRRCGLTPSHAIHRAKRTA
ncbi:hypothetical protein AB0E11_27870 [Streptomyces fradiae]|uniref:hypothetical protein n=1 Tax=Streptomyces fradiae TaxID=1906 RepID=UPI0033D6E206